MTVKDIVESKLREMGADGLCNGDCECGCGLDDFVPCGECFCGCAPARRVKCTDECEHEGGPPYDWHFEPMGVESGRRCRGE